MHKTEAYICPRFSFATRSQNSLANSLAWKDIITLSGLDQWQRLYDIILRYKERKRAKILKKNPFSAEENEVTVVLMEEFALKS